MAGLGPGIRQHLGDWFSFDENGLIRTSEEVDPGQMYQAFRDNNHTEVIERYIVNTQIFAKRFREVSGRSMIIPKRIGADEISPQQFQQRADALLNKHRTIDDSLLMREAKNEILFADIDEKFAAIFESVCKGRCPNGSQQSHSPISLRHVLVHVCI